MRYRGDKLEVNIWIVCLCLSSGNCMFYLGVTLLFGPSLQ